MTEGKGQTSLVSEGGEEAADSVLAREKHTTKTRRSHHEPQIRLQLVSATARQQLSSSSVAPNRLRVSYIRSFRLNEPALDSDRVHNQMPR